MNEGYERMKARRAARDASGIAYVDGSIYENMAACVVRSGITLAHVPSYVVAEEIAAALNAALSPQGLDAKEGQERAIDAVLERYDGNSGGNPKERSAILTTPSQRLDAATVEREGE